MLDGTQEFYIDTNGVRLHVVMAGDPAGKPVILLHGFPDFWYGWRHQVPALVEAGYRLIMPDQRGYNLSEKPAGIRRPYRIDELIRDVIGLIDHFGYAGVSLAGHDWGAAVAWNVAINYPGRIKKLAVLNVPYPSVMLETLRRSPRQLLRSWYIGFFQIPGLADCLMRLNHYRGAVVLLRAGGKHSTFTEQDIDQYRMAWSNSDGLSGMINWYRALVRHRPQQLTDIRVHVPTLILWGKKDVALGPEMAEKSLQFCDDARLVYFFQASHWVQNDEAQGVNRELVGLFK